MGHNPSPRLLLVKVPTWELVNEEEFLDEEFGDRYRSFFRTLVGRLELTMTTMRTESDRSERLHHRMVELLKCLRAFDSIGRQGSWDAGWCAQGDLTPHFAPSRSCS